MVSSTYHHPQRAARQIRASYLARSIKGEGKLIGPSPSCKNSLGKR
jgi:hypothetical protein